MKPEGLPPDGTSSEEPSERNEQPASRAVASADASRTARDTVDAEEAPGGPAARPGVEAGPDATTEADDSSPVAPADRPAPHEAHEDAGRDDAPAEVSRTPSAGEAESGSADADATPTPPAGDGPTTAGEPPEDVSAPHAEGPADATPATEPGTPAPPPAAADAPAGSVDVPDAPAAEGDAPPAAPEPERKTGSAHAAKAAAGVIAVAIPGEAWGFVDLDGNVHQRGCTRQAGRVIGKLAGRSRYSALSFFAERFSRLERQADSLAREISQADNAGRYSERVARLAQRVKTADALGDFDGLLSRLEELEQRIAAFQRDQAARKAELCAEVEELSTSTSWRSTTERLKKLQKSWRSLGSAGREEDERLWERFRGAMDLFFGRRDEQRKASRKQRDVALALKRELCERAETLAESTDWRQTAEEQQSLMEAWKVAGWAGRGDDEKLWLRFRAARSRFFERRDEDRKQHQKALYENRQRKDELCQAAEALADAEDLHSACEQVKQLQEEWKQIGSVPRSVSQSQWQRFRKACNHVFDRARRERGEQRRPAARGRRQFVSGAREQAEVLREAIVRDQGHIDRWRHALDGLRKSGGMRMEAELDAKIGEIESDLAEKRSKLAELEAELESERSKNP